jgi:hypothetical protein
MGNSTGVVANHSQDDVESSRHSSESSYFSKQYATKSLYSKASDQSATRRSYVMNRFQQFPHDSFSLAIDVVERTAKTPFDGLLGDQILPLLLTPASSSRFKQTMQSVEGREAFTQHLHTEYAAENIAFYIAAEDMSLLTDDAAVRRAFETLYTAFILKSSKQSINISEKLFDRLNRVNDAGVEGHHLKKDVIMRFRLAIIADAQREIAFLLEHGSFPRFEQSLSFKSLLPKLQDSAKTPTSTRSPTASNNRRNRGCFTTRVTRQDKKTTNNKNNNIINNRRSRG